LQTEKVVATSWPGGSQVLFALFSQRRRVFRMTALYIISSWIVIQVASEALPALNLDERAIRYVWLAALGGFPMALVFSWKYDITAQGISARPGPPHGEDSHPVHP
jgi:membrane associated rhomboid family serine protease